MAERFQQFREWFKNTLEKLSRRAKILWIVGSVLFVFLVVFLILFLTKTNYVVFNKELAPEQSAQITEKLKEIGIKYKTKDNASTILVEESMLDEARMQMALAGYSSTLAFSYDGADGEVGFTTSSETRNRIHLQKMKKELSEAYMSLEPVERAVVQIYVKKSSTFINLSEDVSKASIILTLKKGEELSEEQINGIESIALYAIEGLDKEHISVVDQNGIQLNKIADEDDLTNSNTQDELKVAIEKRLDKNITALLNNIYGEDNVSVQTSVRLDFNTETTELKEFDPPIEGAQEGLLRSVEELKERVVNKSTGGAPGTDTNTTETPAEYPTGDDDKNGYEKTQAIMNYELNSVEKHMEKEKGQIVDISVAIAVNKKVLEDETLTPEDEKTLVELVKAAAGFSQTSNVKVMAKNFHEPDVIALEDEKVGVLGIPIWVWILIAVGVIAVIVIAVIILKRRKKETEEIIEEIQTEQEELEEIRTDFEDKSSPKYQIEKFIDSRPEVVAQLIRSWMNED